MAEVQRPACADECAAFVRGEAAKLESEVNVSYLPPLVATPYPPVRMICPHGVVWYAEPTNEQIAKWVEDRVD